MHEWDACADPDRQLVDGDTVALFFDGSKSNDATDLVACRITDGHLPPVHTCPDRTVGAQESARPGSLPVGTTNGITTAAEDAG